MNKGLSYIEISGRNLVSNIKSFKKYLGSKTKIAVVVKANAYGHGLSTIVPIIENYIDYFQVDDLLELREIRKISKKKVLVLGYVSKKEIEDAVKLGGILAVYDIGRIKIINRIGKELGIRPKVHIKVDAMLGRQGVLPEDLKKFLKTVESYENVCVDGLYSHLSKVDIKDRSHTKKQMKIFEDACRTAELYGYKNLLTHISATAGILEKEHGSGKNRLARLGIGAYGLWPKENFKKKHGGRIELKPVMRWISHVAQVKTLPRNHPISYNLTFITKKPTKIAVIPQGYSDGYDRGFSNNSYVLVGGKRCKVLGTVAMNMFVADVTGVPNVKAEDEVVILGKQKREEISAEELAFKISTINYEITTRVSPLLPRVVVF